MYYINIKKENKAMKILEKIDKYLGEDFIPENEEGAEKMVANIEKKSGKKMSDDEKAKLKKKFMDNMEKMKAGKL